MRNKLLQESLADKLENYKREVEEGLPECLKLYKDDEEYKELGVLLGCLQALGIVHQSHHWQTLGDNFYGDHLLFERLYNAVVEEVDTLAEKSIGLGSPALTNYFRLHKHHYSFFKCVNQGEAPAAESLKAEMVFVVLSEVLIEHLKGQNLLTSGLEQTLGNILDKHESHIYLLKQRVDDRR